MWIVQLQVRRGPSVTASSPERLSVSAVRPATHHSHIRACNGSSHITSHLFPFLRSYACQHLAAEHLHHLPMAHLCCCHAHAYVAQASHSAELRVQNRMQKEHLHGPCLQVQPAPLWKHQAANPNSDGFEASCSAMHARAPRCAHAPRSKLKLVRYKAIDALFCRV